MRITCLGAAGCVTGSCFLLDNGKKYLVDCGLFQGGRQMEALNRAAWGFDPGEISALLLTHAHIDHCGRIPKLVKDGFKGKIYTTLPTVELCKILLLDSAHIQEMEAEWETRKNRRRGQPDVVPLYTVAEAEACFPLFHVVSRDEVLAVDSELKVTFRNSGHILGSSILEICSGPVSSPHKVVFSGDLGHKGQLIVKDPTPIPRADSLFVESTYGNRNHKSLDESKQELRDAILFSHQRNEKVIIPAFAVERTQEILYIIGEFFREGLIPSIPVYLDSPLAIAATDIFRRMKEFYDEEALTILENGAEPFSFPQLTLSRSAQDSIAINEKTGSAIIIAGNGMCTAGRIKHHLKHNIWRPGCSVVIVGFQAAGTLGRQIVEGSRTIRIFGEKIMVRAKVFTIGGFSAHAGQEDLLEWISHFENPLMRVCTIHGEQSVTEDFAKLVKDRLGFETHAPTIGEIITLMPFIPKAAAPEMAEEAPWQKALRGVIEKAEEVKLLWRKSPQVISGVISQQLEDELSLAENSLDEILQKLRGGSATGRG
jgi:metallo-beta-lactamase family protein